MNKNKIENIGVFVLMLGLIYLVVTFIFFMSSLNAFKQDLIDATTYASVEGKIELREPVEELSIREHICAASNGENCDVLYNLAKCESNLNKEAIHVNFNGTYDAGLLQINSVHKDISLLKKLDVYASVKWANEKIKKGQGNIWVCWNMI